MTTDQEIESNILLYAKQAQARPEDALFCLAFATLQIAHAINRLGTSLDRVAESVGGLTPTTPEPPAPPKRDHGASGRNSEFHLALAQFLTDRARGTRREDLLRGLPWEDEGEGYHYFRFQDLERRLVQEGWKADRREFFDFIKSIGGEPHQFTIGANQCVRLWRVPVSAVPRPTEDASPL